MINETIWIFNELQKTKELDFYSSVGEIPCKQLFKQETLYMPE